MSIRLHPEKGVNPYLTVCRRCGGESNELILIGARDYVDTCTSCGMNAYGGFDGNRCPKCASDRFTRRRLEDLEKLPSSQPCGACQKEIAEHYGCEAIVAAGGVYWKCRMCNQTGVIKPNELATAVRKAHLKAGNLTPDNHMTAECSVEFENCKAHTPGE